jgi:hypothetical protein
MSRACLLLVLVLVSVLPQACGNRSAITASHHDGGAGVGILPVDGLCPDSMIVCGTGAAARCLSLQDDPTNCGACGHACTPGIACVAGVCQQRRCSGPLAFQKIASFAPSLDAGGTGASGYVAADVNRDGQPDLLEYLLYDDAGTIAVWLGQGDGTFVQTTSYPTTGTATTWNLPGYAAVADFDEDGLADLVSMNLAGGSGKIHRGQPGGGFGPHPGIPYVRSLIADVDVDGHLDVVATAPYPDQGPSRILVLRGRGDGTLASPQSYVIPDAFTGATAILDWDGDGVLDILAYGGSLQILYGKGDGTFREAQRCASGPSFEGAYFVDLNHDGRLDMLWISYLNHWMSVVFGQGGCNFAPRADYPTSFEPQGVVLGDLTGDGTPDVLVLNRGYTKVLIGSPDGTFSQQLSIDLGEFPSYIADVNGDGRADVVTTSPRGIEVYSSVCDL